MLKVVSLEPVFTVEQIAEMLQTSERTIQDHIRAGEIIAFPVGRGRERYDYRIELSDFLKFKEDQKKILRNPISRLPTVNEHGVTALDVAGGGMADLARPVAKKRRAGR